MNLRLRTRFRRRCERASGASRWAGLAALAALAACELMGTGAPALGHLAATPTYYRDAQPILAARCGACHVSGGIGPFPLHTYADCQAQLPAVRAALVGRYMPPWQPAASCTAYRGARALAAGESTVLLAWIDAGAPAGSATAGNATAGNATAAATAGGDTAADADAASTPLRADLTLVMPRAYLPSEGTDDIRCFVLRWPETAVKYVTGLSAAPGSPAIVHDVTAYLAAPAAVDGIAQFDGLDGNPGFPCLGQAGSSTTSLLGSWVPGDAGTRLGGDATVGTRVPPGAGIVLQVHYHSHQAGFVGATADQTSLALELADQVARVGQMVALTDPRWANTPATMTIAAGNSDAAFSYSIDAATLAAQATELPAGVPLAVRAVSAHMHLFGRTVQLARAGPAPDDAQCLLDVPSWDFRWQQAYPLAAPVPLATGQSLTMTCHFDNGEAMQPAVGGTKQLPRDVLWGAGADGEMCVTAVYLVPQ